MFSFNGENSRLVRAVDKAIDMAVNNKNTCKHSCILLDKRGHELTSACNCRKTHPEQFLWASNSGDEKKIYLHAETFAIIKAKKLKVEPNIHTAICVRIKPKTGALGMSMPCAVCMNSLIKYGIKKVVYSNNEGSFTMFEIKNVVHNIV
jgi:deoxycytidylate deaminase